MKITNIYQYIKTYLGYKKLFSYVLFSIFLGPQQAFSNIENQYLICFEPSDPEGIEFIPLMYYLENGRVKSYILDKQITNKSIIASDKEYRVKRKVDEKYNISGKKYIFWQEDDLTFLYNKDLSILRTRVLDEDKDSYNCRSHSSKNSFIRQVKKWKKLQNLREPLKPYKG